MTTPPVPPTGETPQFESPTEPVTPVAPVFLPAAPETDPAPGVAPMASPGVAPVVQPGRARRGTSLVNVALGVAVLVATAGVAFAIGRSTAPATAQVAAVGPLVTDASRPDASFDLDGAPGGLPGGAFENGGGPRGGPGLGGGLTIEGTVDAVTEDSVTLRTADGSTVTIGLDDGTTYHEQADATAADVQAGSTVIVRLEGGIRFGRGTTDTTTLGSASDVTVVP